MNVTRNNWWVTPVWEVQTDFTNRFNSNLLDEITEYYQSAPKDSLKNIWTQSSPCITELNNKILDIVKEQTKQFISTSQYHDQFEFRHVRGWLNYNQTGQGKQIHTHGGSKITATYYVNCPANCGDLVLIDPRGGVDWDTVDGKKFETITPSTGSLIFFPSFVLHSVEPNASTEVRVSITTDIVTVPTETIKYFNATTEES